MYHTSRGDSSEEDYVDVKEGLGARLYRCDVWKLLCIRSTELGYTDDGWKLLLDHTKY
jgi:hypothetical protein